MKSREPGAPSPGWAEHRHAPEKAGRVAGFLRQWLALAEMELRKLRHDPTELADAHHSAGAVAGGVR